MSNTQTKHFIDAYYQDAEPSAFYSGMFKASKRNMHSSETVEIDIVRTEEDVSIAIQDLSLDYRYNSADLYTNKGFKPPIHKESIPLNAFDLIKRMPGQNPFQSPNFRANVIEMMFNNMKKVERKIKRSIELQASQVMQTGAITFKDKNGVDMYSLDYKPKASHFPAAGVSWSTATLAQKKADLTALCDQIRSDGLADPDELQFGDAAWENLLSTQGFLELFDADRANLGQITPMDKRGGGGIYRGVIELGNYKLDVFTYNGRYKDPQTGVSTKYANPNKIVARTTSARMDATFGMIPNIGSAMGVKSVIPEMPTRMSSVGNGMDLQTNIWLSENGEQLFGGVGSRPLMIPTAIDTFGCLDTGLGV